MPGKFIVLEGIDGCGKGTLVNALKEKFIVQGKKVFDLRTWWTEHEGFPEMDALNRYDVVISAEPTHTGMGKIIREELIRKKKYSAESITHAYSIDREILFRNVIIPCVAQGKIVLQERNVASSVVYQNILGMEIDEIVTIAGNKLTLENRPDLLVILQIDPEKVQNRLASRDKQDDSFFEKLAFQKKVAAGYGSEGLRELFERFGSVVEYFSTDRDLEESKKEFVSLVMEFLNKEH